MTYNIEKTGGEMKISFTLESKEWDGFIDKAYQKQKGKINIPGFRKGHAPRNLIEKMYGKGIFADDAFEICFRESYSRVLGENPDIYPVEEPKIDIERLDDKGTAFSAVFAVRPEAEIGAYTGLKIPRVQHKVTKADVDAEIEKARQRLARRIEKEGENDTVISGDTVNLDYSGSVDGVKFEGGTAEKQELVIGSGSFIPGFEVQLEGMKRGESRDITVTFPEEYHSKDLAGKEAVFSVTVHNIFTKEVPEINDEMAKEVSRFDTLKEYREDIEKGLKDAAEKKEKAENENNIIEKVLENSVVQIPDAMIETELNYMLQDLSYRLAYMYGGMKLKDYFKYTGGSEEGFRDASRAEAEKNVKTRLVLDKIIKAESLSVSDEEYEQEIEKEAEAAKKTPEEFKRDLEQGQESYIKNGILSRKLTAFLTENNELTAPAAKKSKKQE